MFSRWSFLPTNDYRLSGANAWFKENRKACIRSSPGWMGTGNGSAQIGCGSCGALPVDWPAAQVFAADVTILTRSTWEMPWISGV